MTYFGDLIFVAAMDRVMVVRPFFMSVQLFDLPVIIDIMLSEADDVRKRGLNACKNIK